MQEHEITANITDAAITVHRALERGLLESVCQKVLLYELTPRGKKLHAKKLIPIRYRELSIPNAKESDRIVEDRVVVEVKSLE
jgi:GxxExxY protein